VKQHHAFARAHRARDREAYSGPKRLDARFFEEFIEVVEVDEHSVGGLRVRDAPLVDESAK